MDRIIPRLEKSYPYADNTYENIAFISETQDILVCYYNDRLRTGKIDMFDLLTGEHLFFRDSRSTNPSDNYGLEDVSGLFFDFERDKLYTGQSRHNHSQIGTRAGLVHVWSAWLVCFTLLAGNDNSERETACTECLRQYNAIGTIWLHWSRHKPTFCSGRRYYPLEWWFSFWQLDLVFAEDKSAITRCVWNLRSAGFLLRTWSCWKRRKAARAGNCRFHLRILSHVEVCENRFVCGMHLWEYLI